MAFFATAEDIPLARASWGPKERDVVNPKPPKPPVKPPKKPRGKGKPPKWVLGSSYHRSVREAAVKTPSVRKPKAVRPVSWGTRHIESTDDQVRGRKKPRRIPPAVVEDRIDASFFSPPRGRTIYKPVRARYDRG